MRIFDPLTSRQRRARAILLPTIAVATATFFVVVPLAGRLLGAVWGVEAVIFAVGVPIGMLWWMGERGGNWLFAAWRGIGLALAAALAYAWAFA